MIITGSVIFIRPGTYENVVKRIAKYSEITLQAQSDIGTEIVVNFEADNLDDLERLCLRIRNELSEILDISHVYMNMEDEVEHLLKQSSD
jgi:nitrate reductase NapAB chaperone NapD